MKSTKLLFSFFGLLAIVALTAGLISVAPAKAASILTVNTTDSQVGDDGVCALHEAVINANDDAQTHVDCVAGSGAGTIVFADSLGTATVTYLEGGGSVTDPDGLTIDGGGDITVSGENFYQVFVVTSGASLTVTNLTIANGSTAGDGGGIANNGMLTVTNSVFSNNKATTGSGWGGAIYNNGTAVIADTSFTGNMATFYEGGAVYNTSSGLLTISNSSFSGNGSPSVPAGAISNHGTANVSASTFSGNTAVTGGAIFNMDGTLTLINSTITGNSATTTGGGIYSSQSGGTASLTVINSTIANNTGGGGVNVAGATTFKNTIVSNNTGGNCTGTITNGGNNLDDGTTCGWASASGSMSSTDPKLGTLMGSPAYYPLLVGSPAINAGDNTTCADAATVNNLDQRGVARPQNGICDIGAYEYESVNTAPVAVADGYTTKMGAILNAESVLANDTDADGDTLAAVTPVVSNPSHAASFTFNPDGTFSYTPVTGYRGTDTFSYKANDGALDSNIATVTITITPYTSTFVSVGKYDGWIMESGENSNLGSKIIVPYFLRLGDHDHNQQDRAFVFFNTGNLPDGAVITKATLRLRKINEQGENPFTWGGNLLADIKTGFFGVSRILERNDFQAKPTSSNVGIGNFTPTGGNWYQVLLKASGRTAINRTGPTQFRLRFAVGDNDNQTIDFIRFYSGNQGIAASPQLIIEYYVP